VNGTEAQVPDAPGNWTGRVRALDPHDNPGEWSSDVEWTQVSTGGGPAPTEPRLALSDPTAGSTVNGTVRVHWEPDPSVALVRVEVSADAGETWTEVGVASEPPIEWDTRAYADGTYVVRVLAEGPAGSTSELVPDIIVDNLSPLQPSEATTIAAIVAPPTGTDPDPRPAGTSTPLPTAIAASLVLLAAACVAAWLLRRATSK
jgi:hypothetical protein